MPSSAAGLYQTSIGIGASKEVEIVIFNQRAQAMHQAAVPTGDTGDDAACNAVLSFASSASTKWAVAAGPIEDPRSRRICVPGTPGSTRAPMTDRLLT